MRKIRLLKQGLAVLLSLSMGFCPCLPGILTAYGESVQEETRTEEKATASDATSSDAMFDEDGFLLDGTVADDAESATSSDAELLLEGTLLNVSENALLSGTCGKDGDNLVWEITGTEGDYTLRISGTGEMEDYLYHGPWFNCGYTIDHWILEEGMTSIGEHAFDQCAPENDGVVTLPESVKVIKSDAFMNSGMKSIRLPGELERIESRAFYGCALTEISLPDGLKAIGHFAFHDCQIEELVLPGSIESMGLGLFARGSENNTSLKKVVACEGIEYIGGFELCKSLEEVQLPSTLKVIGSVAFRNCSTLKHIDIPEGVEIIENEAFYGTALEEILLPDSIKEIQNSAFNTSFYTQGERSLNVHLPESLEIIGNSAFICTEKLNADSNLPRGLKKIGSSAFCHFQWSSLEIPETVEEIGVDAFRDCPLEMIHADDKNEVYTSKNNALINKVTNTLVLYPQESEESIFTVPNEIVEIGPCAFRDTKLTQVVFPDTLNKISESAFIDGQLSEIEVPGSVKEICDQAFYQCSALESVVFNDGLEKIGKEAFSCSGIKEVLLPDSVTSLGKSAFAYCKNIEKIILPGGLKTISEKAFCLGSNNLKLSERKIKELYIPEGVTCLEGSVFDGRGIEIYHIPNSLTFTTGGYNFRSYLQDDVVEPKLVYYNGTEAEWNNISWAYYDDQIRNATIIFNGTVENPDISEIGWIEKDGHPWQYRRPDGTIINNGVYNLAYIGSGDSLCIGNFWFRDGIVQTGWDDAHEHYYCGENEYYPYGMERNPYEGTDIMEALRDPTVPGGGQLLMNYDFATSVFQDDLEQHPFIMSSFSDDVIEKTIGTLGSVCEQLSKGNIHSFDDLDWSYWYTRPEVTRRMLAKVIDKAVQYKEDSSRPKAYKPLKSIWKGESALLQLRNKLYEDMEEASSDSDFTIQGKPFSDYGKDEICTEVTNNILNCTDMMINMSDDIKQGYRDYAENLELLEALSEACGSSAVTGVTSNADDMDQALQDAIEELKEEYQNAYLSQSANYFIDTVNFAGAWVDFLSPETKIRLNIDLDKTSAEKMTSCAASWITNADVVKKFPLLGASVKGLQMISALDGRPAAMESVLKTYTLRNCLVYKLNQLNAVVKNPENQAVSDQAVENYALLFELTRILTIMQYEDLVTFYEGATGLHLWNDQDKVVFLNGELNKLKNVTAFNYFEGYGEGTENEGKYSASNFQYNAYWEGKKYVMNGTYYRNQWAWIAGEKYYFNNEEERVTGFYEIDGNYYYFNSNHEDSVPDGAMETGVIIMQSSTLEGMVDLEYYFFPSSGIRATNTYVDGRYYNEHGVRDKSRESDYYKGISRTDGINADSEYKNCVRLVASNALGFDKDGNLLFTLKNGELEGSIDPQLTCEQRDGAIYLYYPGTLLADVQFDFVQEEAISVSVGSGRSSAQRTFYEYNIIASAGEVIHAELKSEMPEDPGEETPEESVYAEVTGNTDGIVYTYRPEVKTASELPAYVLKVSVSGKGGVVLDDGTSAEESDLFAMQNSFIRLTAVPEDGESFKGWFTSEGELLSAEEVYLWIAERESEIEAWFSETAEIPDLPDDPLEVFIRRLYTICLGREADAEGLAYWKGRIESGNLKGVALAGSFVFSKEFTGKNYCNEHFMRQLYKALMGREADAGGLNYWVGLLENGTTREAAVNSFASSNEYRDLCSAAGIELGSKIKVQGYGTRQYGPCAVCGDKTKVVQFAERMYTECMKRSADASGLAYWSKGLYEHTFTGRSILYSFFLSNEIKNMGLTNQEYVRRIYRTMLDRDPDDGGLGYWAGRLDSGASPTAVINGFIDSNEFTKICNDYGIVRK